MHVLYTWNPALRRPDKRATIADGGPECTASCTAASAKCDTVSNNEPTPSGKMHIIIKIKVHN